MYDATIEYCGKEIQNVSFLTEKTLDSLNEKSNPQAVLKRLITRFFNLYENEPLFEMYVFIHTEQYFNKDALEIVRKEFEKITDEIKSLLSAFCKYEKIDNKTEKELKESAAGITAIIFQQRDMYIANRKETVRQNPESGAGSLFALPTDEAALNRTVRLVDCYFR